MLSHQEAMELYQVCKILQFTLKASKIPCSKYPMVAEAYQFLNLSLKRIEEPKIKPEIFKVRKTRKR